MPQAICLLVNAASQTFLEGTGFMAIAKPNTNLNSLLNQWKSSLQQWAKGGSLVTSAQEALLLSGIPEGLQILIDEWAAADFKSLPEIELLSAADISGDKRLDPAIELYSLDTSTSTYIKLNENDNKSAISLTDLNDPNRNPSLQVSLAPSTNYYLAVTGSGNTISNPTLPAYGRGGSTGNYNLDLSFAPEANRSGRLGGFLNQTVTIGGDINQATLQGSSPDFDLNLAASLQSTGIKNGDTAVELSFTAVGSGLAISGKLGADSSSSNHPFSALFRAETKAAATASVSSDRIGADDVDIFPFSVAQAGAYQLSTRNQGDSTELSKPTIRLFKADGTELTNGKIAAPAQGLSEQHILTLAAGNYYAVILPTGAATKNFALDSDTSSTATGFQPGFSTAPSKNELQEFNRSIGSYLF